MDALVTAGGIPKIDDPLYEQTQGNLKAILDVAGKPMIQWVLDAIGNAPSITNVVIIGLEESTVVTCTKPVHFVPNQGDMLSNIRIGVSKVIDINPDADQVLVVSSDIPAITAEMIEWAIESASETDHDFYYNIILKEVMESRFPGSKRSYVRLTDGEVCGADMNIVRADAVAGNDELWNRLIGARKNALKQASMVGFKPLLLLLTHRFSLERDVPMVSNKLGIKARAILCPYAEIGMDIDKPYQLDILQKDLRNRAV